MNKRQGPRLRFQGFAGVWEEKVLGENASFTKGSGYSKSDLTDSGFPIILYGRLYTKYENIIENVDTFVSCDENSLKSLGNEVIVPASGETAEDIARASAVYQQDVILGGDLNIITPNENIASPFLALTLTNGKSNQELAKKAQGKSVVHLRNDDLRACKVSFPSFPEQTHLGLFFRRLDSQIAESRAVLEKSRQLKKAMLAKMFPANGEKIPKIRFKGFEGEWESRKLGEVVEIVGGYAFKSAEFGSGNMAIIRISNILPNGSIGGDFVYFGEDENLEKFKANKNDYLIAMSGATTGKIGQVRHEAYINQRVGLFRQNENSNNDFIGSLLQKEEFLTYLMENWGAGAQPNISIKQMENYNTYFPNLKEQTAIGLFFRQLDETIALQSAEVEKLNQLKKGLLAAMLV